jgi:hypothetical protein
MEAAMSIIDPRLLLFTFTPHSSKKDNDIGRWAPFSQGTLRKEAGSCLSLLVVVSFLPLQDQ